MLDSLPDLCAQAAWKSELTFGDVVLYRFPVSENDGSAKPKPRPCLVLDLEQIGNERLALITYGTTSNYRQMRGYSILSARAIVAPPGSTSRRSSPAPAGCWSRWTTRTSASSPTRSRRSSGGSAGPPGSA